MDCSLPGFSVHGIFQARVLEWAAISFSKGSSQSRDRTWVSCIVDRRFYSLSHQGSLVKAMVFPVVMYGLCPWDSPGKNTGVGCHFLLQCMEVKSESEVALSCPTLATPWTAAHQAPPSMGVSRQEYWSGLPLPSPFNIFWIISYR